MKSAALYAFAGTFVALALPALLAAQEETVKQAPASMKTVRYVGELNVGGPTCGLSYKKIQVDIAGDSVSGWYEGTGRTGKASFRGTQTGDSIKATYKQKAGSVVQITGILRDDVLAVRVDNGNCKHTAVLTRK